MSNPQPHPTNIRFVRAMLSDEKLSLNRILVGIGANLAPDGFETPRAGCEAAIARLPAVGIDIVGVSAWFETAPVPLADQPWFANAVISAQPDFKRMSDWKKNRAETRGWGFRF